MLNDSVDLYERLTPQIGIADKNPSNSKMIKENWSLSTTSSTKGTYYNLLLRQNIRPIKAMQESSLKEKDIILPDLRVCISRIALGKFSVVRKKTSFLNRPL